MGENKSKGCFKNRTKKRCAQVIGIISVVLIILGLFSGIFGFFGVDRKETWEIGDTKYPSPVALFGLLAIIVGLFVVLTGCLGICAARFKKCCFTMPFMIFCMIMAIIMLIIALVGFVASGNKEQLEEGLCKKPADGSKVNGYESLEVYMQNVYGSTVNKMMCTPVCPCNQEFKETWEKIEAETLLKNGRNRVFAYDDLSPEQKITLNDNRGAEDIAWEGLEVEDAVIPLYFEVATEKTLEKTVFNTFNACFTEKLSEEWKKEDASADKKEYDGNGMAFFKKLEEDLDCGGVCWLPIFGISRSIKDGPVEADCVDVMLDSLKSLMAPAIVCLITFFVLLCACCSSIPLCTGYDPKEDEEDYQDNEGGVQEEDQQ